MSATATEWVEPGQGATVFQLLECVPMVSGAEMFVGSESHTIAHNILFEHDACGRGELATNLALTGNPWTQEDSERLADERFQVD